MVINYLKLLSHYIIYTCSSNIIETTMCIAYDKICKTFPRNAFYIIARCVTFRGTVFAGAARNAKSFHSVVKLADTIH